MGSSQDVSVSFFGYFFVSGSGYSNTLGDRKKLVLLLAQTVNYGVTLGKLISQCSLSPFVKGG